MAWQVFLVESRQGTWWMVGTGPRKLWKTAGRMGTITLTISDGHDYLDDFGLEDLVQFFGAEGMGVG